MKIVAFFCGFLKSAWNKIEKHSVGLCWMLGTLSVCFVLFISQEIRIGNDRLNHLVEKASLVRNLKNADNYIQRQHRNMLLMEKGLQEQQKLLIEQDRAIKTLIDKINRSNPKNWTSSPRDGI
jgi:hypothetical protein